MDLVRRQRHLPAQAPSSRTAAARVPADRLLVETDAPYLSPQRGAQGAQPARLRRRTPRASSPRCAASPTSELEALRRGATPRAVRMVSARDRRSRACGACASSAIRPNRELGQNFLVDSNILGVIERAAELGRSDVALEIGGGLGVLSEHLAARVAHVHVVEIDRALEPALRDALDAVRERDAAPRPTRWSSTSRRSTRRRPRSSRTCPTASPPARSCARSSELPSVDALGGDGAARGRRAARRRARRLGLRRPSRARAARLRRAASLRRSRAASSIPCRTSTRCSSCCARRGPARAAAASALGPAPRSPTGARRLPKSLSLSLRTALPAGEVRDRARAALAELGHPADVRAERLAPEQLRDAARSASRRRPSSRPPREAHVTAAPALGPSCAPAKVNLCLYLGPGRADGRHELVSVIQPLALADDVAIEPAERRRGRLRGRRRAEPRRRRARRFREARRAARRCG